ncbi:hypothetical protein [Altericista sp. CCNU0014]|uniref:hypothetical protein n=1 Tax=Altericista sp. CCNU0014 TaxID=3082949 RepID=UPI00385073F6
MQSTRPEILSGALRNPTVMAMIGSAGIHGILVLFSVLKPAESLPAPLRIVNIAPGGSAAGQPTNGGLPMNGLPVPNGLPPINLGDVPELSALPDLTKLQKSASQSVYLGSNPSSIDLGKLSIQNPPQRSVAPNLPSRTYDIPKNLLGAYPRRFNISDYIGPSASGNKPLPNPPDYSGYKVDPNPSLTRVNPGVSPPASFNTTPNATPDPASTPIAPPEIPRETPREISPEERGGTKTWAIAKGKELGQDISIQTGPSLSGTYPAEANASGVQETSARVAVLYGPDGSVVDVQTVRSADNLQMTAAAIETAKTHSIQPNGAYQIVTFEVMLRPAAPLKETVAPNPTATPTPSPESGSSASPKPSPSPSAAGDSPSKAPISGQKSSPVKDPTLEPKPSPAASEILVKPATPLSKDEVLQRFAPKASSVPAPSPSPAPSEEPSASMEPLPAPAIEASPSAPPSPQSAPPAVEAQPSPDPSPASAPASP